MDSETSSALEQYLEELGDPGKELIASKLVLLSDMTPDELAQFSEIWPDIDVARRRKVLNRLVVLAEDNLELDFDRVFRFCITDADTEVRTKAIEGLCECNDCTLIDELVPLASGEEDHPVREAAIVALGRFVMLAELGKLGDEYARKVEDVLLALLGDIDESVEVRCRALESISPLSRSDIEEAIRSAYHSEDRALQASAVYAMGQNCNPGWLPILLSELHSPIPRFRFEAARACAELEAEEAVPKLSELTEDNDVQVSLCAVEAMGKIGGTQAKEALQRCLDSPSESIRDAAHEALQELGFWEDPFMP
jgi:HEAT repeat protein